MIKKRYGVGAIIREHRESLGIRQKAVAATLGITPGYLSQVESGMVRLADKHYRNLPVGIREPATAAAIEELAKRARAIAGGDPICPETGKPCRWFACDSNRCLAR